MSRKSQIFFICLFLFIIYTIPGVQTVYEWVKNPGHRIQMLDMAEDLLVTPMKKAHADYARLTDLNAEVNSLAEEIKAAQAVAGDTTKSWDSEKSIELIDEAVIKVKMLEKSLVDYNRHVMGKANVYVGADTVKPYYRTLQKLRGELNEIMPMVEDGVDPSQIAAVVAVAQADAQAALQHFGGKKSAKDYPGMTLVALSRIMVGASYLRPYEKEMEKSSVFANSIRPVFQFLYYVAYRDLGDKGVLGRNGWFFYRPDVEYLTKHYVFDKASKIVDANDVPIRDAIVDTIASFKNALAKKGIDLLVVIMPGKPSIYPDMLNEEMKAETAGKFSHSLRMMKDLNAKGIETVDLFSSFAQERTRDAEMGDSLYLHTDTHFRTRGVTATAKTVADRVKQYPWYQPGTTEYAIDTVFVQRDGDIGTMTKLPSMKIGDLTMTFPLEHTKCYQVWRIVRDEAGAEVERKLFTSKTEDSENKSFRQRNSQVFVLGDSFTRIYLLDDPYGAGWVANLAYELGQPVQFKYSDGGASTIVRENLREKDNLNVLSNKKLVVWEIVERDFRFGDGGWKDVPLTKKEE